MQNWIFLAAAAVTLGCASPVLAQQPTQAQGNAIRQACRADYEAHCASVPTGGSAALACLQQNASALSSPCQQALAAVSGGSTAATSSPEQPPAPSHHAASQMSPRQKLAMMRQACGEDYRTWCSGIRPGGGEALACLKAHEGSLSRRCRVVLQEAESQAGR